jgi:hypothetical protein
MRSALDIGFAHASLSKVWLNSSFLLHGLRSAFPRCSYRIYCLISHVAVQSYQYAGCDRPCGSQTQRHSVGEATLHRAARGPARSSLSSATRDRRTQVERSVPGSSCCPQRLLTCPCSGSERYLHCLLLDWERRGRTRSSLRHCQDETKHDQGPRGGEVAARRRSRFASGRGCLAKGPAEPSNGLQSGEALKELTVNSANAEEQLRDYLCEGIVTEILCADEAYALNEEIVKHAEQIKAREFNDLFYSLQTMISDRQTLSITKMFDPAGGSNLTRSIPATTRKPAKPWLPIRSVGSGSCRARLFHVQL